jgi:hypothetical protein
MQGLWEGESEHPSIRPCSASIRPLGKDLGRDGSPPAGSAPSSLTSYPT